MPLQSLGEQQRKNVSLTRLEPKREVAPEPDYVEERDWRSYRKPSEQIFYSDTGQGYVKQYPKKAPRSFMERRQPQGMFASDVGTYYGLSSYRPETTVVALKSASELEWEQQQREFKLWRMISTSDLSEAEKEQLHIELFPWAGSGIRQAHAEAESHKFYQGLGFPEFGGKYAPFTVPSGAKVKGISETSEGLKIEFEQTGSVSVAPTSGFWDENRNMPVVKSTSGFMDQQVVPTIGKKIVKEEWLSEQLYNVQMGSELVVTGKGPVTEPMRPFAPLAFLIAPAEYFVYGLVTMIRGPDFPAVSTPPATPTLFTNPVGVIQAGRTAMAASLLGEILLSETIGLFSTPIVEGVSGAARTLGSGAKATGYLAKDYVIGTETFKDFQLASRGLMDGLIGEEPYMYLKNVFAPTVKGVYAPEVASMVRTQLAVLQGVPRQAIKDVPFLEETVQYRSGVLFNQPLTSMIGSALVTEDVKLAARGLAEGFIGSERYSYLKSVAVPMTREIYLPEASQKVSTFFAVLHGVPAEAIKEIPNPVEAWQMYRSGVLFNEPFVSIAFPHVAKPQDIMFLKSVFAPNLEQYYSLKMPSLTLDSEAWAFLTEPTKTAKAYGKVAAGRLRYEFNLPTPPSNVVEHTPLVFDAPKETAQVQRIAEASQVAIQVKPEESLSVTGMPKTFLGFLHPRTQQREEETEIEVLSYPASAMSFAVAKPLVQTDFLQRSPSRAVQGLSGFEVAPRLKPTATTFNTSKAETFNIPTAKTGLFKGLKGSSIMAPKSASRFTQSTNLKPLSLSESGLKLDQGLKQNMAQASKIAEQYQLKQRFQFPEEPFKRKGGRRKRKKAKAGIADWYVVDWPLSKPEDFLKRF